MRNAALILILLAALAAAASAQAPPAQKLDYAAATFGEGRLVLEQPRCVRMTASGEICLLEGGDERVSGVLMSADGKRVRRFGANGRVGERADLWYHPASVRPCASGDMLAADTGNRRILRLDADGAFKSAVVSEGLEGPTDAIELDAGRLVVCDSESSRILLYDAAGKLLRVIASSGNAPEQVNHPFSLALGGDGLLWAVDVLNHRLIARDAAELGVKHVISPMDADGPALRMASYLDFDVAGNLLVAEARGACVLKLSREGKVLDRIGARPGEVRPFATPSGVCALPDGGLLISDTMRSAVFRFDARGRLAAEVSMPHLIAGRVDLRAAAVGPRGDFYTISGYPNPLVSHYGADGTLKGEFGAWGTAPGTLCRPRDIATGPDGSVYVADSQNHNISVFSADGVFLRRFGNPGNGPQDMRYPRGVAVSAEGLVFVSDAGNRRVQVYAPTGAFVRTFAANVDPQRIRITAAGRVAVHSDAERVIVLFGPSGRETARIDIGDVAEFDGMAFAPDGALWVLDSGRGLIKTFAADGQEKDIFRDAVLRSGFDFMAAAGGMMLAFPGGIRRIGPTGEPGPMVFAQRPAMPGKVLSPAALALVWNDELAVASSATQAVQVFGRDGTFRRILRLSFPLMREPKLLATAAGELLVLDELAGRIVRVAPDGAETAAASGDVFREVQSLAEGPDGTFYLMAGDRRSERLCRVDARGKILAEQRGGRAGAFRRPQGLFGTPTRDVLLIDRSQGNVLCYGPDLALKWTLDQEKLAGNIRTWDVRAARIDAQGRLYLLGAGDNWVRVFDAERAHLGMIQLDERAGGRFRRSADMVRDAAGNLYVADTGNNRIIRFVPGK